MLRTELATAAVVTKTWIKLRPVMMAGKIQCRVRVKKKQAATLH